MIFFGLGLAYAVWVLVRRPVLLTIDADGFTDSSSLVSVGRVRWANVAGIQLWKVSRQTFICVDVLDENQLPRRPAWKRAIDWADRALVCTPIAIGLSTAQVSPDEGLALLEQGWADWKRRNSWPEASATEH